MVDKDSIRKNLYRFFSYRGHIHIDEQGVVSLTSSVEYKGGHESLPVRFGEIGGSFIAPMRGLTTLVGAPHTVHAQFICWGNPITSWEGAPIRVVGEVQAHDCRLINLQGCPACAFLSVQNNPLKSLEGIPENLESLSFTFEPNLPLLKSLQAKEIHLYSKDRLDGTQALNCYNILRKYAGQGRPAILKAAAELIRAGYPENARW